MYIVFLDYPEGYPGLPRIYIYICISEFVIFMNLQNQCATEIDDEGKVKYFDDKHGDCGPGCPTEEDEVWLTDDTLMVTRNFDTDRDSLK